MIKEPRLRFTEEEQADPALGKPVRKAEKAAAKADKAQAKIPKKQVKRTEVDPKTGKVTTKLVLEDKPRPPSKLSHSLRDAPGNAVAGKIHQEIQESEDDNVGVESAQKSEEAVETGVHLVQEGYRSHKLKPYRKAAQAERQLEKANINALYQKSLQDNPQAASNPLSRWQQKQQIKKQYAAAKRAAQSGGTAAGAAQKSGKAAKTVKEKAQQAGAYVMQHKKGFIMVLAIFLLICLLLNTMSSCSMMAQSIGSMISGTTYPSDDPELVAVEADYAAKEAALQAEIDNIESSHPGYDEYRYDLDNPTIYLTTKGGGVPQKDKAALTDDQAARLLDTVQGLPPYVFVMLGLYAGLRREEILALKWDAVYLDGDFPYLAVRRAWHTENNRPVILDELKTKAAERNIPLPTCLAECLKEAKANSTSEYVVANRDGEPLSYTQFKRLWQYIVTRTAKPRMARKLVDGKYVKYMLYPELGEKARNNGHVVYSLDFEVTPHQLRHTYITNLIHSSVDPKTVQYLAGHESSKITMDIYAKVKYNRPDELVRTMGNAFAQWDAVRA